MISKTIMAVLFAITIATIGMTQNVEAFQMTSQTTVPDVDRIAKPSIRVIDSKIVFTWNMSVPIVNGQQSVQSRTDTIGCSQGTVNAFYDTNYNKRIVTWQLPSTINQLCGIFDKAFGTNTSYDLETVQYVISGDGNKKLDVTSNTHTGYKTHRDATSNSGNMQVKIIATYTHAI